MIVSLAAIEVKNHDRVVSKRLLWLRIKEDIAHFVKAWVDAK